MAASKAQQAWGELNARQRAYLKVMFEEDQGLEEEHRYQGATGKWSSAPAKVWRRIFLSGSYAAVPRKLRRQGIWESGAGSTMVALADRGLIERGATEMWEPFVLLTRAGRAAVRAGLDIGPAARKKPWELSEWLWRQMAKVARAGAEGPPTEELFGSAHLYLVEGEPVRGNRPYLKVVKRRGAYTPRDFHGRSYPYESTHLIRRYHFTERGRAHYREYLAEYREFYPDIEAPDLPEAEETEP